MSVIVNFNNDKEDENFAQMNDIPVPRVGEIVHSFDKKTKTTNDYKVMSVEWTVDYSDSTHQWRVFADVNLKWIGKDKRK